LGEGGNFRTRVALRRTGLRKWNGEGHAGCFRSRMRLSECFITVWNRTTLHVLLVGLSGTFLVREVSAGPPILSGPTAAQGEFRFVLSGESNATYTVETSSNLMNWAAIEMSSDVNPERLVTVAATNSAGYFRARVSKPFFANALTVRSNIDLAGHNLRTSFDPSDPASSTDGRYDPLKFRDNGDVAAYSGLINSVNVVTGDFSVSGMGMVQLATGASLNLYVGGSGYIGGNGVVNDGRPKDAMYYGMPSSTNLGYSGNGTFVGCIYAPNADFILNGVGNNVDDFVGASVTRTVRMQGHFNFHFDESLKRIGPLF
jgi:hypothetical protein